MQNSTQLALDPVALSTFAASLAALPKDEIRKAKSLFIRNAIADYRMALKSTKGFLIVMGIMCVIPVFIVVFIPAYLSYKAAKENGRQKIENALAVWGDDLGPELQQLRAELNR